MIVTQKLNKNYWIYLETETSAGYKIYYPKHSNYKSKINLQIPANLFDPVGIFIRRKPTHESWICLWWYKNIIAALRATPTRPMGNQWIAPGASRLIEEMMSPSSTQLPHSVFLGA